MTRARLELGAWVAGGAGLVWSAIAWIVAPHVFAFAWLAALSAWLGWALGCLGLLLIHAQTGGRWGIVLRPVLVAGVCTLPLLLPLLVPLLLELPQLYNWVRVGDPARAFYLNLPFFAVRWFLYLIVWFGLGALVLRAMRADAPARALAPIAPVGLILMALTVTFAMIDLTESLDPGLNSSIYGMIAITENGLLAMAVGVLWAAIAAPPEREVLALLGRLLLGLVVLWAYLDFMQLLIVWQSDLPPESPWYLVRIRGGWAAIAALIAATHFVLPFFVLLSPTARRSRRGIGTVAAVLVLGELLRGWWLVLPARETGFSLADPGPMLAILGLAAAVALRAPGWRAVPRQAWSHG